MKNLLLLTAFLFSAFISSAQFETGQKLIGGQFGISSSNNKISSTPGVSNSTFFLSFSPSVSRFKSPLVISTTGFSYSYSRYRNYFGNPASERIEPAHSFGVFFSRTKLEPLAKKFYFTYTGTVGANSGFIHPYYVSTGAADAQHEFYGAYLSGSIGLLYQLSQRFLLTCELTNLFNMNYQHTVETGYAGPGSTYKNTGDQVNLSTNLAGFNLSSMTVGVRYMMKK
ncbi:MAG: hypothetical protein V4539_09080 [Bacteroidota bacterium]